MHVFPASFGKNVSEKFKNIERNTKNLWKKRIKRDKCLRNACQ